jgi:hypothetical protein
LLASAMILGSRGLLRPALRLWRVSLIIFPKGYGRAPGAESVLDPHENEVVVFKDFFTTGLRMPPHPVLLDILCKFWVQLHQLTSNAIVQIIKFIWAVASCEGHPTANVLVITMSCTTNTRRFISKGPTLLLLPNLVEYLFIRPGLEIGRGLPLL